MIQNNPIMSSPSDSNSTPMMFSNLPDLMDVPMVMSALGIGRTKAYQLIKDGSLKSIRIGSQIRIPKVFLIDYINEKWYNPTVAGRLSTELGGN